ncbi:MAG: hypothetical protein ACQERE_01205 [Pseudomonadota bacterium]
MWTSKSASAFHLILITAFSLILMGCQADDSSSSSSDGGNTGPDSGGVGADNNVQVQVDGQGDGTLILYRLPEEGNELEELNRAPIAESDTLFDIETIPDVSVVQAEMFEDENRWGVPVNVEQGDFIALSPLTQVVYNLAGRDGITSLDVDRVETLNEEVREGLAPGVNDLYAGSGALEELPEDGGLAVTDPEVILLHRLGLEAVAANEGTEENPALENPQEREESQLNDLLDDLGSGVVSGYGRNGFELTNLPYNPLTYIERYETALEQYAEDYGNDAVNQLINGNTSGEEGPSTGESAYSRFVSRDARCENTEELDQFFGGLESADLSAESGAVAGKYEAGNDVTFNFEGVGISSEVPTEDGTETIGVGQDSLYTCALTETENDNGETQLIGLVRFVQDIDDDGELDEVTVVDDGEGQLGVLIASDSGTDYAGYGDVNPLGGGRDDDNNEGNEPGNGDDSVAGCGFDSLDAFATRGEVTAETDTVGLGSVSNVENAVDDDTSTTATLSVPIGLLGAGQAEVIAQTDQPIQPETNGRVAALISIPDSIINLNVLENYTIDIYSDGEQVASNVDLNLADVDVAGAFNQDNVRLVEVDSSGVDSFDEVRFRVNAGVLSTDIRTEVHELCYGSTPTSLTDG